MRMRRHTKEARTVDTSEVSSTMDPVGDITEFSVKAIDGGAPYLLRSPAVGVGRPILARDVDAANGSHCGRRMARRTRRHLLGGGVLFFY